MIRISNYLIIALGLIAPVTATIDNPFLWAAAMIGLLFSTIAIINAMPFEDNLMLLAFLVSLPWIFYVTELPGVNDNIGMFLGTIFLGVAVPFVLSFLFFELARPLEE